MSKVMCPSCGGIGESQRSDGAVFCSSCGAVIQIGKTSIHVTGTNADEVGAVAGRLAEDASRRLDEAQMRSPWLSGLFYLTVLIVVVVLLLVVGSVLTMWALPIVIVGAVLLMCVVGALQLRQDDRLTEAGFLTLMGKALRQLPSLLRPVEAE